VVSFSLADRGYEGEWGWGLLTQEDAHSLLHFLCDMAALSWDQVRAQNAGRHRRHHPQPITSLCSAARRRLRELDLEDLDSEIFRFRLSGLERLWGFAADDGTFYALWWDPNHRVYPTEAN